MNHSLERERMQRDAGNEKHKRPRVVATNQTSQITMKDLFPFSLLAGWQQL